MPLKGYERDGGKRNGGISSLQLISAAEISGYVLDPVSASFTSITLNKGSSFSNYHFKEDSASMTEAVGFRNGFRSVTHTLVFTLEKMGEDCIGCVNDLADNSGHGYVALIEDANGSFRVIGVSEKFGIGRPLAFVSAETVTGNGPSDMSGVKITLRSTDTQLAAAVQDIGTLVSHI